MPLANPTVKTKPWTILPSLDQRGAGGLKGVPLAKIFARTREDLAYDPERLKWVHSVGGGTEAGVQCPHQGNSLSQRRNI